MKSIIKKIVTLSAVAIAMTSAAIAAPVYLIAQIQIEDQEKYFSEYAQGVIPIVAKTGAKVLVATPSVNLLEGEWTGNWTVVIEFPSEEAAMSDWYESEDYVEVRKLRFATTSVGNLIIAPSYVPPKQ